MSAGHKLPQHSVAVSAAEQKPTDAEKRRRFGEYLIPAKVKLSEKRSDKI